MVPKFARVANVVYTTFTSCKQLSRLQRATCNPASALPCLSRRLYEACGRRSAQVSQGSAWAACAWCNGLKSRCDVASATRALPYDPFRGRLI